jgi:hypothetical protein
VHSTLIALGYGVPMADLFGLGGGRLLAGLEIPQPWRGQVDASLELIDDLELRIARIEAELKGSGADHRYLPLAAVVIYAPGQMGASPSGAWSGGLRSCVGPGAGPGPCPRSTQGAMLWLR